MELSQHCCRTTVQCYREVFTQEKMTGRKEKVSSFRRNETIDKAAQTRQRRVPSLSCCHRGKARSLICALQNAEMNWKLTGLRQMHSGVTPSRHRSRRVQLERRFGHVDVVDVVLGSHWTQLAAMAGDRAVQPAHTGDEGDRNHSSDHDHDRKNDQHHTERPTSGKLDRPDGKRQPSDANLRANRSLRRQNFFILWKTCSRRNTEEAKRQLNYQTIASSFEPASTSLRIPHLNYSSSS